MARTLLRQTQSIRLVSHALNREWVNATSPEMENHCRVQPSPIDVSPRTRKEARERLGLEADAAVSEAFTKLDKAAKAKLLHPNKAARAKSRLNKALNKARG